MSEIFRKLLKKRGIDDNFVHPKYEDLPDVKLLPDIESAVRRIKQAVANNERVLIFGDYDADGVTASVVMHDALKLAGVKEIEVMLPNRFEDGYGMSGRLVEKAQSFDLVVTVDCGSNNAEIVAELNKLNVDVIITDHHECLSELPPAVAVVNPKREEGNVFYDLAGVGVAFMVARALVEQGLIQNGQEKWLLDLVLIGTICDNMRITWVNRCLTFWGMKVLAKTRRLGLIELIRATGVKKLNSVAIGFMIGPRINAAGRVESPDIALKLLMTESRVEALKLAGRLEELNNTRKAQQEKAVEEITKQGIGDESVIVAVGDWNEGVLGIVAGRLVDEYHRPVFVMAEKGDALKGSGRSAGDFNLAQALCECQNEIVSGGGHAGACGVKVLKSKIGDFRVAINKYYDSLRTQNRIEKSDIVADLEVNIADLSLELNEEISHLEPYGDGNSEPIWLIKNLTVIKIDRVGKNQNHLGLLVRDNSGRSFKLLAFCAPEEWFEITEGNRLDVWFELFENEWNGLRNVEGRIRKIGVEK